jgi:hypothetical protein
MNIVVKVAHSKQQTLSTEMKIGGALTQQPVLHVFVTMLVLDFIQLQDKTGFVCFTGECYF